MTELLNVRLLFSSFNIFISSFVCFGMMINILQWPALFIIFGAAIACLIQYLKLPDNDPQVSRNVVLAEWKTGGNRAAIIGHMGGSFDAPGNTLVAFREAAKNGADGIELDVLLTKDNIGVLMHDDIVDRTTNGSGKVSQMTYKEIKELDAAAKHPFREKYAGTEVPTFEEGIQECLNLNLAMYIDVKSDDPKVIQLILDMFKKYKLHKKAVVCAFHPKIIYKVRSVDPAIVTVQLMRPYLTSYDGILNDSKPRFNSTVQLYKAMLLDKVLEWSVNSWLFYITGASGVSLHHDYLSRYMIDQWRSFGFEVLSWTVNDKAKKNLLLSYNVPVITDSIKI